MNISAFSAGLLSLCLLSAQQPVATPAEQSIRVYDVGDLIAGAPGEAEPAAAQPVAPSPLRDLPLLGELFERRLAKKEPSGPKVRLQALADLVREFVEPRFGPHDEVQVVGERAMVVLGSAAQHAWIANWLTAVRATPDQHLDVSATWYTLTPAAYATHFAPLFERAAPTQVRLEPGVRARSLLLAPGAETLAFVSALAKLDGVESLASPRVLARMRESVTMRVGEDVAYIKDFKVTSTATGVVADPIVDTVWDGLAFGVVGSPLPSGHLGLAIETIVADLALPIPSFETSLGVGAPVTLQLPRVRVARLRAAVELPKDHLVLFSVSDATDKPLVVLVRAQVVSAPSGTGK